MKYIENIFSDHRTFVIGDVHGNKNELIKSFQKHEITDRDFLIFLGDLINKGHDSKGVLDILLQRPNTLILIGNHESFFIDFVNFIEYNKFNKTHISTSPKILNSLQSMSAEWILDLSINEMIMYKEKLKDKLYHSAEITHEGLKIGMCHASVPFSDWNRLEEDFLRSIWSFENYKNKDIKRVDNIDFVVHGHSPVKDIERRGNIFYIDTLSHYKGKELTFLDIKIFKKSMSN
jgi:predicted phosphodiesterase